MDFEDLLESWEAAWPESKEMVERIRTVHPQAELDGIDLMARSTMTGGLRGLMQLVEQTGDWQLCAAVRAARRHPARR
ncbi:hypothetical protein ACFC34_37570 [Streptomyces sp. NPDC056053]|uniref:hypothetical protein n=1 Tax=Streptomyces sp. NPDC056053 TaxID=3345696 RepID=UPI0035D6B29A